MFSRRFAEADPGPPKLAVTRSVREFIVGRVRRCTAAGLFVGDDADIAHVLVALVQGLAAQETAGWLGTSKASIDRRWALAFRVAFAGLRREPARPPDGRRQSSSLATRWPRTAG